MSPGLFITATNTEVGKTTIGLIICDFFNQRKISYFPYKPVESGVEDVPADAWSYYMISKKKHALSDICPFAFKDPVSPTLAAEREQKAVTLCDLTQLLQKRSDFVLVEGAGGWYSPLTSDGLVSDLAKMLQYPVLFVVQDVLGAVNQALLTYKAILAEGLLPVGAVLNFSRPELITANLQQLQRYLPCPVFPITENFEEKQILRFFEFFDTEIYPRCISGSFHGNSQQ